MMIFKMLYIYFVFSLFLRKLDATHAHFVTSQRFSNFAQKNEFKFWILTRKSSFSFLLRLLSPFLLNLSSIFSISFHFYIFSQSKVLLHIQTKRVFFLLRAQYFFSSDGIFSESFKFRSSKSREVSRAFARFTLGFGLLP
jgi:hypothetical protein